MKLSQKHHQRLQQAFALHESGHLEAAAEAYRGLLRALPGMPTLLSNLGMVLLQMGREGDGLPFLERSLRIEPAQPSIRAACAMAYVKIGRPELALTECTHALRLDPMNVVALHTKGLALHLLARYEDALASFAQALHHAPSYIDAWCNRGLSLVAVGRSEEALESFDQALKLNKDYAPALINRIKILLQLRRNDDALETLAHACRLFPHDIELRAERADLLFAMRRLNEAEAELQQLVEIQPDNPKIWRSLAHTLDRQKQGEKALACFERAWQLVPGQEVLVSEMLAFCLDNCYWPLLPTLALAIEEQERLGKAALRPFDALRWKTTPESQLKTTRCWMEEQLSGAPQREISRPSHTEAKQQLRIGFISSDFHNHPVVFLLEHFLPELNRDRLHLVGIQTVRRQGGIPEATQRWFDSWVDVGEMSGYQAEARIAEERLDVAINLNGITAGERTELFAMRLAPLQVNFLGYAGTTGAPFMDYVIADEYVLPSHVLPYYTEQAAYLPDTFFVPNLAGLASASITRDEEGLPGSAIVFCCFNNAYKITPEAFDIWMRLLRDVPESVLWLSQVNDFATKNLRREAAARHIDPDRLIFASRKDARSEHLRRLELADLFLDTFYYNAHTTASDALWAGVPVLTCPGDTFASRVAGSLLRAAGMEDLITDSLEAYEAKALQLALDPTLLAETRARLARNKTSYPVFDMPRYARNFERLLWAMWERHVQGLPPGKLSLIGNRNGP